MNRSNQVNQADVASAGIVKSCERLSVVPAGLSSETEAFRTPSTGSMFGRASVYTRHGSPGSGPIIADQKLNPSSKLPFSSTSCIKVSIDIHDRSVSRETPLIPFEGDGL